MKNGNEQITNINLTITSYVNRKTGWGAIPCSRMGFLIYNGGGYEQSIKIRTY